jgi:hypothetical protein
VFSAFGLGAKPTIYGSDLIDTGRTLESGTTYKVSLPVQSDTVVDGTTLLVENDGNF